MKVRIEIDKTLVEDEVIIQCRQLNDPIQNIQRFIVREDSSPECMMLKKGMTHYYIPLKDILFFETSEREIKAHTAESIFMTDLRLYELEDFLPGYFLRISKSTIININHVYSVTKNLTASSVVEFNSTHKKVYVSRHYYKALANRLEEKWKKR